MTNKPVYVWRIRDRETGEFRRSGTGLYANIGRSVWMSRASAAIARSFMLREDQPYLEIVRFRLIEDKMEND